LQGGADFRQTAERFAAAGRTKEKTGLHARIFPQSAGIAKQEFYINWQNAAAFLVFLFGGDSLLSTDIGRIGLFVRQTTQLLCH